MELQKLNLEKPYAAQVERPVRPHFEEEVVVESNFGAKQVIILVVALVLGFGSSYLLKTNLLPKSASSNSNMVATQVGETGLKEGDVIGMPDNSSFKDNATGYLDKGGLDGEGSHKLVRPGGVSQTVYLVSSIIDLDELVGHQVTVYGQTFKGQKAGWLMDVGQAKVEKLNAQPPE